MHKVRAKGILSSGNGMNVYRGCSHGCIYCDARSDCYNMEHDFEDIEVKENAPELLEAAIRAKRRRCIISSGAMCDPYLHEEKELKITRRCLEIIEQYRFGAALLTKSDLIMRDIDLLDSINRCAGAYVQMTLTTADEKLCRIVEPNVCTTSRRFEVLCEMKERGIPTVIWLCPILPFINDTEENILAIIDMAKRAGCFGIISFGIGLTLRSGDREYYYQALDKHFPGLKRRYVETYGSAYELPAPNGGKLWKLLVSECEKSGIEWRSDIIFKKMSQIKESEQLTLFDM